MYLNEITMGLRAMGHATALLTQQVSPGGMADGIYNLADFQDRRKLPGRILDSLGYRTDPSSAIDAGVCRSIVAAARRAIDERGTQILEMEESFGWSERVRRSLPIPVIVRLHGPWFLNGAVANSTDDPAYRKRVRARGGGDPERRRRLGLLPGCPRADECLLRSPAR